MYRFDRKFLILFYFWKGLLFSTTSNSSELDGMSFTIVFWNFNFTFFMVCRCAFIYFHEKLTISIYMSVYVLWYYEVVTTYIVEIKTIYWISIFVFLLLIFLYNYLYGGFLPLNTVVTIYHIPLPSFIHIPLFQFNNSWILSNDIKYSRGTIVVVFKDNYYVFSFILFLVFAQCVCVFSSFVFPSVVSSFSSYSSMFCLSFVILLLSFRMS